MSTRTVSVEEEKNKKRGMMISIAMHVALLMLAILPMLTFPDPPPGQEGILVNLGLPDQGQGDENAGPAEPQVAEESETEAEQEEVEPVKESPKAETKPEDTKKEVVTSEDPNAIKLKKEKERKEKEKQDALEKQKREAAEAERRKQEAEAKAKAEKAQKESDAKNFGESLGLEGLGKGKGNTGKDGNQGDPNGDPNSDILTGISTGSGMVGDGLGSRGVSKSHKPTDNSNEQGTVVVRVCVDRSGNVIEAEWTQKGSSAVSTRLKNIAISSAKQWKFKPGDVDKQCGTITYNFKTQ
ncbi:MAG TPA: TonB family protein [Saprospiraceae bacterium]|nr:TonB family protein [Saprospiraceae bacterium]HMQ81282.1 TonB family protein [Saprospiraceae bacterium]